MLKNQLDDAKDRESFYQNQIETMQRLLEAPKANITTFPDQEPPQANMTTTNSDLDISDIKHDGLTTTEQKENPRIPVPEHIEPESKKRGFWSRFFLPNE